MLHEDALTLRTRFLDQWTNGVTVIYDNQLNVELDETQPFVRFSVQHDAEQHELGGGADAIYYLYGRVIVSIFVPRQSGTVQAYSLADTVSGIFRSWRSSDFNLLCETARFVAFDDDPKWYQINVTVPWFRSSRY